MENNEAQTTLSADSRNEIIVRTSIIGILANVLLAAAKAVIGLAANSIAVILDAVNNLSDAMSSIITILGAKLAGKAPDKEHPFGYGRVEYLSAMIVAGLVLYAGITSAVESVKKIITPEKPDYSVTSLIIIAVAVVIKIILGSYVKKQGKKVKSGSLIASGSDALFDAVLSASVLASAIVFTVSSFSSEAYVGALISVIIVKSGIQMMTETLNEILGMRADKEITDEIKRLLASENDVRGVYDLIMYNYGPDKYYASVHLELPDTMTAKEIDRLTRKLESKVYKATGVILAGVGLYSYNTGDSKAAIIQRDVQGKVLAHDWAVQVHGFYLDTETKEMRFDVVFGFDIAAKEGLAILYEEMRKAYPDYAIQIVPDVDVSVSD
jgi:cation diffusion facilitator family transporter